MIRPLSRSRRARKAAGLALAFVFVLALLPPPPHAAARAAAATQEPQIPAIAPGAAYRLTTLVSDVPGLAPVLDPLLVNPWGISMNGTSPFWVANQGTDSSTLYGGDVGGAPLVKSAGRPHVFIPGGSPTGTVANTTSDFAFTAECVNPPCPSGPARFIFASLTGRITAWFPALNETARIVASMPGHVWTGLAIGSNSGGNRLYAADFANNHIDVFDGSFAATTVTGGFADPTIPAGYAPFNIQNLGGSLYVTYAKVGAGGRSENGAGFGYVRKFDTNGVRDPGFAIDGGALDAPWGLEIAPASFGLYGGALLVGNFSHEGRIHAFNPATGAPFTAPGPNALLDESGQPVEIDELWALQFGNGNQGGDPNALYFTAGIAEEQHGLFGKLSPTTQSATSLIQFASDSFAIGEGSGHIDITVTRAGDASGAATVNYNTIDTAGDGHASQKSDYEIALGTLRFAPGETSKTFRLLLVDDRFVEGAETIGLTLSNPTGAGAGLGSPTHARLTINDNDTAPPTTNPIDEAQFFVRQHYLDFLNREPDPSGFNFWVNQITSCGDNLQCREVKRVNVSAAFFLSIEFQETGFLAYSANKVAFGGLPLYGQFMRDVQALQRNFIFGQPGAAAQLEANKRAYFDDFVTRPEFVAKFGGLNNRDYVNRLLSDNGLSPSVGNLHVSGLSGSQEVPPRTTPATGVLFMKRSPSGGTSTFKVSLSFSNLTSPQTGAHIHGPAPAGSNAPILHHLPLGEFTDFEVTLTPEQMSFLNGNQLYVNVHTQNFPGGEIRGQIRQPLFRVDVLTNALNDGVLTRAQVLRIIAEFEEVREAEFNRAFVLMQYFGYLRRNPQDPPDEDLSGYNFWLSKLNSFNGNYIEAEMVKAFINSSEYRQRFGPN